MVERKSALRRAPHRPRLEALLEQTRDTPVTDEMLLEQRASFVYGNAPAHSKITKDSARKSTRGFRVTESA